ncbi:MAG: hypothetical protein AAB886_01730 [Patescibacteria group bacterium]
MQEGKGAEAERAKDYLLLEEYVMLYKKWLTNVRDTWQVSDTEQTDANRKIISAHDRGILDMSLESLDKTELNAKMFGNGTILRIIGPMLVNNLSTGNSLVNDRNYIERVVGALIVQARKVFGELRGDR